MKSYVPAKKFKNNNNKMNVLYKPEGKVGTVLLSRNIPCAAVFIRVNSYPCLCMMCISERASYLDHIIFVYTGTTSFYGMCGSSSEIVLLVSKLAYSCIFIISYCSSTYMPLELLRENMLCGSRLKI